jgi:meiotically up-regulated gene 157 (Mug157) protein
MDVQQNKANLSLEANSDQAIADNLRQIEKRDWWVWGNSIFVMLLLTGALIRFALSFAGGGAPF